MDSSPEKLPGVEYHCPQCRAVWTDYRAQCPQCGRALNEDYCATYHLPASPAIKAIAALILIGALALAGVMLWAWIRTGSAG